MNYFVTAIGTDSGKTLVSAILVQALLADYWKPIQAGEPRDTDTVKTLVSNSVSFFHPSAYNLKIPASPHAAARAEGIVIDLNQIKLPEITNDLIIEGAGGVLVPLNNQDFVIDIADRIDCEIILVSDIYLGSINHTLLTIQEIKRRDLKIKGLIFNGERNPDTEQIILQYAACPCLLHITPEPVINSQVVNKYAEQFQVNWFKGK